MREFGALGRGQADESAAIQAAIDAAARTGRGEVHVPAGTYVVRNLRLYSNIRLVGDGSRDTTMREVTGTSYLLSVNPGKEGSADVSKNEHDIEISNLTFDGPVAKLGFNEHQHLLNFNGVTRLHVHDCTIRGFRGDGIYLGSGNVGGSERHNTSVRISGNEFDGVTAENRNGISVVDGTEVLISHNRFVRCSRRTMPGPIDIEPNGHPFQRIREIAIEDNRFEDCGGGVAKIAIHVPVPGSVAQDVRDIRVARNFVAARQRSGHALYVRVIDLTKRRGIADQAALASGIRILDNTFEHGNTTLQCVSQFMLKGNRFTAGKSSVILGSTHEDDTEYARLGTIDANSFEGSYSENGALIIGRVQALVVYGNNFAGDANSNGPAIVLAQRNGKPLCQGVTLDANQFSDAVRPHVLSRAPAVSEHVRVLGSNRTSGGKAVETVGMKSG